MPKKMAKAATEHAQWTDEDTMAITRAWNKGYQTPTKIKNACGFDIDVVKIKSKLQQLQRGDNPVLVNDATPCQYRKPNVSALANIVEQPNHPLPNSFSQALRGTRCSALFPPRSRRKALDHDGGSIQ